MVWDVTDSLSLTGGVRYSKDPKATPTIATTSTASRSTRSSIRWAPRTASATTAPTRGAVGRTAIFDGSRTDYHFSADYRFNPAVMAYASVGTGYKAGGVGPRPFNPAQAIGFGPEKVTSYEIGLKTDLFDRTVRFNTAVFYNDFKDAQLVLLSCPQYGGPGPCALPQNAGDANVKGVEAEIIALPFAGLQFDLSGSYLHWDWKCVNPEVVRPGATVRARAILGDRTCLSATPIGFIKEQAHAGIQYEIPLGSGGYD